MDLLVFEAFAYFEVGTCDIPALNAGAEVQREDCILFKDACSKARSLLHVVFNQTTCKNLNRLSSIHDYSDGDLKW